jgi:hypothetical protein
MNRIQICYFFTQVCEFLFQLKVSGNNLTSVCKLVFKVSRNEKNDPEFLRGDILGELKKNTIKKWIYILNIS